MDTFNDKRRAKHERLLLPSGDDCGYPRFRPFSQTPAYSVFRQKVKSEPEFSPASKPASETAARRKYSPRTEERKGDVEMRGIDQGAKSGADQSDVDMDEVVVKSDTHSKGKLLAS